MSFSVPWTQEMSPFPSCSIVSVSTFYVGFSYIQITLWTAHLMLLGREVISGMFLEIASVGLACCGSRPGMRNSQLWDSEHHHMTRNYRFLPGNVSMSFFRGGFRFVGLIVAGVIQWPCFIILLSLITRWALPDFPRVRMWGYSEGADVAGRRELREMCHCLPAQDREGAWFLFPH